MKRKKSSNLLILLLFILGLGILLYPSFSNWWNQRRAESLMVQYEEVIEQLDTKTIDSMRQDARQYNAGLIGNVLPDAFAEEEANSPNVDYEGILNVSGDGFMGTVEIPVINVHLPIYHYTTEEVLEKGVGHLPGSSVPVGGESTHSVLSAHRGLPSAKLFTELDLVKEGDVFYLHVLGEVLAYQVNYIRVIEPTDTSDLAIIEGEDLCTLFTCTPYAVNSHRLLVRGTRIPYSEEQYQEELTHSSEPRSWTSYGIRILCVLLGLLIAALLAWLMTRKDRKPAHIPFVHTTKKRKKKTGNAVNKKRSEERVSLPSEEPSELENGSPASGGNADDRN